MKMTVKTAYWKSQELVMIGVFAAAIKLSSLLIALAGGGMNPVTLILKNLVFTTLLIVLLACLWRLCSWCRVRCLCS